MLSGDGPVFQQLARSLADDILHGTYAEETSVPSATDFAVFHQMNPATASKGVNVLVEVGALYKRRGIGMFVATGARELLRRQRREEFGQQHLKPLLREAALLGITTEELHRRIDQTDKDGSA